MPKKKTINFVHLHGHSYYSLLDGVTKPEEAVEKAAVLGMPALAFTDHGNCHGCADLYFECMKYIKMGDDEWKAMNEKRLSEGKTPMVSRPKPIVGMEAYFTPGMRFTPTDKNSPSAKNYHMVVLARTTEGWRNLCRMHYKSWKEGFYRRPRIDTDLLKQHGAGLIVLSACLAGYPQQELLAWSGLGDEKRYENAKRHVLQMKELTDNHYWLEVQDTKVDEVTLSNTIVMQNPQLTIAEGIRKLAADTGVRIVLTNDFHFLNREDKHAQSACSRIGERESDRYDVYNQNWMKSAQEMSELFYDNPEWMEESLKIAALCDADITLPEHVMPVFPIPKEYEGKAEDELLVLLAQKGLEERYPVGHPRRAAAIAQMDYELSVIIKMRFPGYFLIVWDIYRRAHELKIACGLGRGSAAGSIVAYCLGITQLCPLEYDLLFERFLNPDRVSMPDIDMDFDAARRDELILYAREKYGQENVANIISYQTMKSKAVLRDVARTYDYDPGTIDKIAKSIPVKFGKPDDLRTAFKPDNMKGYLRDPLMKTIYEDALKIEGNPKSRGTHASGILITPKPCYEYIPMEWDKNKDMYMTSFEDTTCDNLGLLKLDFLGIKSITIYKNCKDDIKKHLGIEIVDSKIPFNDSRTWQMLAEGDTHGVFQMEAGGFQRFCRDLGPDSVNDLVAMVALYRPGPMAMGTHTSYIKRKAGTEPVDYLPGCEEVLKSTYGLMFYQETVMQVTRILCGFTRGESDNLRKAIGKKDAKRMAEIEKKWKEGAAKVGLLKTEEDINKLWDGITGFAEYGFNRAHAAVYGVFSYWTAYLKANFPQYYLKAMLNDRRENKTRMAQYINVCRSMGLMVEPPNVNKSEEGFVVEGDKIIFGLDAIKGVSPTSARSIVHARTKGGPFKNLQDFCNRVPKGVESNVVKGLIYAGAFDDLFKSKDHALNILPRCIELAHEFKKASGQGAFMELAGEAENPPTTKDFSDGTEEKHLAYEVEALGFYLTDTPLKFRARILRPFLEEGKIKHLSDIPEVANTDSKRGIFVGVMTEIKQKLSKRREPYWRFQLQEEISVETTAFASVQTEMEQLVSGDVVIVLARAEYEGGDIDDAQVEEEKLGLLVDSISKLETEANIIAMVKKAESLEEIRIRKAENKCQSYQGNQGSSRRTEGQSGSRTLRSSPRE
jgi:DNA polymerase III subunit alpha